jgi:glucosyl-3-phosphoglycerate synthase
MMAPVRTTLCLPARDEEATIGRIVEVARELVDEILVVDDGSSDRTAALAARAGARVVSTGGVGKGGAMRLGVEEAKGEVVAFCDADIRNFAPHFVTRLLAPLASGDDVFVKGFYRRDGGRVTELVARPLLRTLFPHLAHIRQPLAGECAARRTTFRRVAFEDGWGVDIGLVLDLSPIVQVDLGERIHQSRPLHELVPQAEAVVRTMLGRAERLLPVG